MPGDAPGDSFRTNSKTDSNLFSRRYLEWLLPETQTWKSADEETLREAFDQLVDLYKAAAGPGEAPGVPGDGNRARTREVHRGTG